MRNRKLSFDLEIRENSIDENVLCLKKKKKKDPLFYVAFKGN